jgi:hypothetical protein
MWLSTVCSDMNRRAPICLLLRPSATNCATSAARFRATQHPNCLKPRRQYLRGLARSLSTSANAPSRLKRFLH